MAARYRGSCSGMCEASDLLFLYVLLFSDQFCSVLFCSILSDVALFICIPLIMFHSILFDLFRLFFCILFCSVFFLVSSVQKILSLQIQKVSLNLAKALLLAEAAMCITALLCRCLQLYQNRQRRACNDDVPLQGQHNNHTYSTCFFPSCSMTALWCVSRTPPLVVLASVSGILLQAATRCVVTCMTHEVMMWRLQPG